LGKNAWIICQDAFPERLDVLPWDGWATVRQFKKLKSVPRFDACIVVDCPNPSRIGTVQGLIDSDTTIINIDHHVSNTRFGHYNLVNDRAAACGEIIYELFKECQVPITQEAALPLYVSISTDTGSFRYSNTTSKTHLITAGLIETGIDVEAINENLYDRSSRNRVSLLAHLLSHIKVEMGGKVVWAVVSNQIIKKTKTAFEDTEGFVDFLRAVAGVHIAFILIENGKNQYQVSFRAKGKNDVNQIAECLGGGGHRKAAGCSIQGPAATAAARILSVIKKYLRSPTFSQSDSS
jgi:phosphoesterase RecJ-like protein